MKWKWPFVSRSEHEMVLADRERIRGERNQFEKDRDTRRAVARKATEQYADLYDQHAATTIVNGRLTEDLTTAREELAAERQVSGSLARQIHGLSDRLRGYEAVDGDDENWRTRYETEKKHADQLQQQLDDALGMDRATAAGTGWEDRREQRMKYDKPAGEEVAS